MRSRLAVLAAGLVAALAAAPHAAAAEPAAGVTRITIVFREGQEQERVVAPCEWVPYGCAIALPYRAGKVLRFAHGKPYTTVSIDGGAPQPAWVNANTPEGLAGLQQALDAGASNFAVLCSSKHLDALPVLPRGRGIALGIIDGSDLPRLKRQSGIAGLQLILGEPDTLDALAAFPDLDSLRLSCREGCDLEPLTRVRKLTWLRLSGAPDLSPLARVPSLRGLRVTAGNNALDLRPLAQARRLVALHLWACRTVTDLAPLAGMARLQCLNLSYCTKLERLDPLARLSALTDLDLSGCTGVTDLSPLAAMARRGGEIKVDTALRPQLAKLRDAADF